MVLIYSDVFTSLFDISGQPINDRIVILIL